MKAWALFLAVASLGLSGCASLGAMHADYHCGHDGDTSWRVTPPPAEAALYREAARASHDPSLARVEGREFWFARAGALKFCIVDTGPENPDCRGVPRGVSWVFEQTDDGPRAGPADYAVCLL